MSVYFATLLLSLPLIASPGTPPAGAKNPVPNVLLIAIDDLNDWVGCLGGHPQVKTPNIDRLAARGTLFANAHCQSPLCNPSRTSVLTGLRPSTTGVYALLPGFRSVPALRDRVTLIQFFKERGYSTFVAGKIFHDGTVKPADRAREADAWGDVGRMPYPAKKLVRTPDALKAMDWGIFPDDDRDQADWMIAESTLERFKSLPPDQPFFMAAGFRLPHVPCFASSRWFELYPLKGLILPPVNDHDRDDVPDFAWKLHWKLPEPRLSWLKSAGQWENLVRSYLASISFMDSQVGRVLDALDASGKAAQTVVVLWSDHGWHLGEKGITGKNTLWERSTRVPLILAGPGVEPGKICRQPAELLDVYPTLVDLVGAAPPADLEGHSLKPQLRDSNAPRLWPAITTHNIGNHSVRSLHQRYIRYADGTEEFYDHRTDPNEWTNLANDPRFRADVLDHARRLPLVNVAPVPGSAIRLLDRRGETWYWEGKPTIPEELRK